MDHPFRRLLPPGVILLGIVVVGTVGYVFLEHWTILQSIYMVVITIFTVGFQEVRPLSPTGEILTMFIVYILEMIQVYMQ